MNLLCGLRARAVLPRFCGARDFKCFAVETILRWFTVVRVEHTQCTRADMIIYQRESCVDMIGICAYLYYSSCCVRIVN